MSGAPLGEYSLGRELERERVRGCELERKGEQVRERARKVLRKGEKSRAKRRFGLRRASAVNRGKAMRDAIRADRLIALVTGAVAGGPLFLDVCDLTARGHFQVPPGHTPTPECRKAE
jgi:hypothetical protein